MNNYALSESMYYLYNPIDQCRIGFSGTLDECVDWVKRNKFPCDICSVDARLLQKLTETGIPYPVFVEYTHKETGCQALQCAEAQVN